jgi:hypothetical protein
VPTLRPRPPWTEEDDAVLRHFLGPWQSFTVGSYGDCGWDAVDAALTLVLGLDSNIGNLPLRRQTHSWALAHGDSIRKITGPHPTWVIIIVPVIIIICLDDEVKDDDYLNLPCEDYD